MFEQRFLPATDNVSQRAEPTLPTIFTTHTLKEQHTGRWYLKQHGAIPWGVNPDVKLKVLTDITAQQEAAVLREKRFDSLHQAARHSALAEIAATLAHKINQPLMVITAYTDACQRLLAAGNACLQDIAAALPAR